MSGAEPSVVKVRSLWALDDPRVQRAIELDQAAYDAMTEREQAMLDAHHQAMFDLYIGRGA